MASYLGDVVIHAPRRATNQAWSAHQAPSYSYRFDAAPTCAGATHFQEVAFVFGYVDGEGYATNPFGNMTAADNARFIQLSHLMSRSWVSFIVDAGPNQHGIEGVETVYDSIRGGGVGANMVFTVNGTRSSYIEWDRWRGEGIAFINKHALGVYVL